MGCTSVDHAASHDCHFDRSPERSDGERRNLLSDRTGIKFCVDPG